jgi:DNA-binding CsgD family transcriptional regulator
MALVGRTAEQATLDQLLTEARAGRSASLVLRGAPGIGKTALLEYAARRATGCRIVTARGVEAERDLPYAALHLLCASVDDSLKQVPSAQRDALQTAIGLRTGPEPDRFLAVLGLRALLSAAAAARPLLCIIDDAQWLDRPSAHVLVSAARRLKADSVVLLLAERQPDEPSQFSCLPELALDRLSDASARQLFAALIPGRVDQCVLARLVAETRGNPRALLEFLDGVAPADFAGGLGLSAALPARGVDGDLQARLGRLPEDSWRLLLLAAAEPVGDPAMIWRAAAALGIPPEAAESLEADGLLSLDSRALFGRPLLRRVVYGMASKHERRHAHRALADVMNQAAVRDRRAWHRAQAAAGPDDEIALELDACAATVRERAGLAAAAAVLERAAMLTLEAGPRVDRALRAAAAKIEAADPGAAAKLVVTAELGATDHARRHRVERSRAQVASAMRRGSDAAELLVLAAQQLEATEPAIARDTYLEAVASALRAGHFGSRGTDEIASAARLDPTALQPPRAADLLLDALTVRFTKSYEDAVEPVRRALDALACSSLDGQGVRWLGLGCRLASDVWDDQTWHALTARQLERAREADSLAVLPYALTDRALVELSCGDLAAAAALVDEADTATARTGSPPLSYASLVLAAWRGDHGAFELFEQAREDAQERAEGAVITAASYSAAVLSNGLRRYDDAFVAATEAADCDQPGLGGWALVELVEAAARRGRRDAAACALERLSDRTRRIGSDWALGTEARCRALLSDDRAAEDLYREAIERLGRTRIRTELVRAQLVYGEWLRRQGRRLDARTLLRAARESFVAMGAGAFAERAHLELLATGETARSRSVDSHTQLTPQEARVAVLARDGLTNPEIGERLFVSPRTVEYHLHKVFAKLGVRSRRELHLALADGQGEPSQACAPSVRGESDVPQESRCA